MLPGSKGRPSAMASFAPLALLVRRHLWTALRSLMVATVTLTRHLVAVCPISSLQGNVNSKCAEDPKEAVPQCACGIEFNVARTLLNSGKTQIPVVKYQALLAVSTASRRYWCGVGRP